MIEVQSINHKWFYLISFIDIVFQNIDLKCYGNKSWQFKRNWTNLVKSDNVDTTTEWNVFGMEAKNILAF